MVSLIVGLSVVVVVEIALVIWIYMLSKELEAHIYSYNTLLDTYYKHFMYFINNDFVKEKNCIEDVTKRIDEIERLLNEPVVDGDIAVNDIQMKDVDANLYGAKKAEDDASEETFIVEETD